jgi:pimeloyl-ACP methyl ester carboxylesterase
LQVLTESPIRIPNAAEGIAAIFHAVPHPGTVTPRTGLLMVHSQGASKTGHKRSFVELARRLAPLGIPVLRFDLLGEGESEDLLEDPYLRWRGMQPAIEALFAIQPVDRLIAMGDCFGGLLAAHYALLEPRIERVLIWNITQMKWTPELLAGYTQPLPSPDGSIFSRLFARARTTEGLGSFIATAQRLAMAIANAFRVSFTKPIGSGPASKHSKSRRVPLTVIHGISQPQAAQAIPAAEFVFDKLEMEASHVRIPGVPFSSEWKAQAYATVLAILGAGSVAAR